MNELFWLDVSFVCGVFRSPIILDKGEYLDIDINLSIQLIFVFLTIFIFLKKDSYMDRLLANI